MRFLLSVAIILFSQEAYVSGSPKYIGRDELIASSQAIIIAKKLKGHDASTITGHGNRFKIVEVIMSKYPELKLGSIIDVAGAFDDLFAAIDAGVKRGEPRPIPILPFYKGKLSEAQFKTSEKVILFLSKNVSGAFCFAAGNAYEAVLEKSALSKLILKENKAQ